MTVPTHSEANQLTLEDVIETGKKRPPPSTLESSEKKRHETKVESEESEKTTVDVKESDYTATSSEDKKEAKSDQDETPSFRAGQQNKNGAKSEDEKPTIELKKNDDTDTHSEPIKINRAPVLDLFASCCAQFQHPDLTWETCLSLGSAVASMCALSKGRALGQIPKSEDRSVPATQTLEVLRFQIPVKDGHGFVGDTRKTPNEAYLKSKFGPHYEEVKEVMTEALKTWKGHEGEFSGRGFHMYEKFRPGSGEWGAKGGLVVEEVKRAIMR